MATHTPNLNLFKYDVKLDAQSSFNIERCLNDNWDILDYRFNELSNNILTSLDIIDCNSSDIPLQRSKALYRYTPTGTTTFSFNTSNLNLQLNEAYTFELLVPMSTVRTLSFTNVTWNLNEIPDLSSPGTYYFAFRTINQGSSWIGNLQGRW